MLNFIFKEIHYNWPSLDIPIHTLLTSKICQIHLHLCLTRLQIVLKQTLPILIKYKIIEAPIEKPVYYLQLQIPEIQTFFFTLLNIFGIELKNIIDRALNTKSKVLNLYVLKIVA